MDPPTRPYTHRTDLTQDYGNLGCVIKPLWNRWSQHTHTVYVDLHILAIVRTLGGFETFSAMKPDIQVFLSLHRH